MSEKQFGRFIYQRIIGKGGMGVVVQAYDPQTKRDVALKILPPKMLINPESVQRFRREAAVIASLEHPAIVPVYDSGIETARPYLVMRLMAGGSLADRIAKGPIPLQATIRILKPIASAIDFAHEKGVVHRDIKPSNILFDEQGNPHLVDFGIVGYMTGHTQTTTTTTTGGALGTPHYMSPEQAEAKDKLDGRSDIYSLGIVLFEMLTGTLPYKAETPLGLALAHKTEPVPDILARNRQLPSSCDTVIRRSLAKDKAARYPTAQALVDDLEAVLQGKQLIVSSPARTQTKAESPIRYQSAKKRRSVLPAVVIGTIMIGVLAIAGFLLINQLTDKAEETVVAATPMPTQVAAAVTDIVPTTPPLLLDNQIAEPQPSPLATPTITEVATNAEVTIPTPTATFTPEPTATFTFTPEPTPVPTTPAPQTTPPTLENIGAGDTSIYRTWRPTQVIEVGGTIQSDTVWTTGNLYRVNQDLSLPNGVTLTIQPGVVIKVSGFRSINIAGTLTAIGTESQPILFTALTDDTVGGDTNGDTSNSTPNKGYWDTIELSTGADSSVLSYVEIRYAGRNSVPALSLKGASPSIDNISVRQNFGPGILVDLGSMAIINNTRIEENSSTGIQITEGSRPTISNSLIRQNTSAISSTPQWLPQIQNVTLQGNNLNGLVFVGGTISESTDWYYTEYPIVLSGDVSVVDGATLTIQPGVVIKVSGFRSINIAGTLTAIGTESQPILFTALTDDTVGGDTNGDTSNSTPNKGYWDTIELSTGADSSVLSYVEIRYAGRNSVPALSLKGASPSIDNMTITNVFSSQIRCESGARPQISNSSVVAEGCDG